MDSFSNLLQALEAKDESGVRDFITTMTPRVELYLTTVVGGSPELSKEAASTALLNFINKVKTDSNTIDKNWKGYLLKTAQNHFILINQKESRYEDLPEDFEDYYISPSEQIDRLVEEERISILKKCLQKLNSTSRKIILYLIRLPQAKLSDATERFKMSHASLRRTKSKTVKQLQKCYEDAHKIIYE